MPCSCDGYDMYSPADEIESLRIQLCRAQSVIYKLNKVFGMHRVAPDLRQAVTGEIDMLRNHKLEEYLKDAKSDFNSIASRVAQIQDLGGVVPPDLVAKLAAARFKLTTEPTDLELLG